MEKQISDCSFKSIKQTIKILFFLNKVLQESEAVIFIKSLSRECITIIIIFTLRGCQVWFRICVWFSLALFVHLSSESEFNPLDQSQLHRLDYVCFRLHYQDVCPFWEIINIRWKSLPPWNKDGYFLYVLKILEEVK